MPEDLNQASETYKQFEEALRLLHDRRFSEAHEILKKVRESGDSPRLSAGAEIYLRICHRQISGLTEPAADSADEHYSWGIYFHNRRDCAKALEYFGKALELSGDSQPSDHIYYAMAASEALLKNTDQALEHLRKAVEIEGVHGFHARNDPDFRPIVSSQQFQEILELARESAGVENGLEPS